MSAVDVMKSYFGAKQMPVPDRMNWKGAETAEWIRQGRVALTDAERAKAYGLVQEKVHKEHLWMPVMNVHMYSTSNKKIKGNRAHMIYQNTFYKGLDLSL